MSSTGSSVPRAMSTARRRVSRPQDIVGGTRWLFWMLAMVSLLLSAPPVFVSLPGGLVPLAAVLAIVALAASNTAVYLRHRAHLLQEIGEAMVVLALASFAQTPGMVVAYLMALIWFRSLYGSSRAVLVRCCLLSAALLLSALVWPLVPGHDSGLGVVTVLSILPTMFLTSVAGRHLATIVTEREKAAARDAIHASAGKQLLGVTDSDEIVRLAWDTTTRLCAMSPGLRVLRTVPDGGELRVIDSCGDFTDVPTTLPLTVVGSPAHDGSAEPDPSTLPWLDAAAGMSCSWRSASLNGQRDGIWLVIGSSDQVPVHAVDTLTSFVMHTILAMRNSVAHQKLTVQATMDSLTGLANRSLFNLSLGSALSKANGAVHGTDTAVLFVDLDDFKDVNDVLGHAAGDELLREVAARLRSATRPQDMCARLGGDEFAVLLYRTGAETATEIARRIVKAVSEPMQLADGVGLVGASIGVAVCTEDTTPDQLVKHADIAMYAAKAAGKGRVQLFADGLLRDDDEVLVFDRQVQAAVQRDELLVHYQPIVSLRDDRCTAAEALVRWAHPLRGLLVADDFIDAAERTGAIRDIGRFVLRRACADAAEWRRSRPDDPIAVHVNVSALQLDDDFSAQVRDCLAEFSIPADQLVLELTETVVLASPDAIGHLDALAADGVVIAVDDFGTGYAALTTLRSLPVSLVKVGASFVAGSTVNQEDRAVAEAIVQMASRLGLETIADGVERPDQRVLFESLGATSAQGSLYARPTTSAELCTWLARREPQALEGGGVLVPFPERRSGTTT